MPSVTFFCHFIPQIPTKGVYGAEEIIVKLRNERSGIICWGIKMLKDKNELISQGDKKIN